ncbi:hypothetical protein CLOM_g22732 [Closterium sp. NIES-68]|nr:hypothetical protein CLOM_g22732 [Closterium sp. NIES-68]GJP60542.1 hypothetical protein CLOP_g17785 [Closterium sp. NIES-67]
MFVPSALERPREREQRVFVASPVESVMQQSAEQKAKAQECVDAGVKAGFYNAAWAAALTTPPTIIICRTMPWAKRNLNHTAQALIISSAAIAAYFITSEHAIMDCTKRKSMEAIHAKRQAKADAADAAAAAAAATQ